MLLAARQVWIVPIVHTLADMGSLAPQVAAARAPDATGLIEDFWDQLQNHVLRLEVDFRQVRVYQDSLPECGREVQIVEEVARSGSANFRLLRMLMRRGARVEGTESVELLLEEFRLVRQGIGIERGPERAERLRQLGLERDRYIAARIDETLQAGEVGIVFLGMLHDLPPHLATDIEVRYPFTMTA